MTLTERIRQAFIVDGPAESDHLRASQFDEWLAALSHSLETP